jgi:hypothetical protein
MSWSNGYTLEFNMKVNNWMMRKQDDLRVRRREQGLVGGLVLGTRRHITSKVLCSKFASVGWTDFSAQIPIQFGFFLLAASFKLFVQQVVMETLY